MFAIRLALVFLSLLPALGWAQSTCVNKDKVNLRENPRVSAKSIVEYKKYTPLRLTGKKQASFVEVTDQFNKTGWVRSSEVDAKILCVSIAVKKSRMRSGPGSSFEPAQLASQGETFKDHGGEDGWTKVETADGTVSWVRLEHIWRPRSKMRMSFENP